MYPYSKFYTYNFVAGVVVVIVTALVCWALVIVELISQSNLFSIAKNLISSFFIN